MRAALHNHNTSSRAIPILATQVRLLPFFVSSSSSSFLIQAPITHTSSFLIQAQPLSSSISNSGSTAPFLLLLHHFPGSFLLLLCLSVKL